jgi:hypothetical protein
LKLFCCLRGIQTYSNNGLWQVAIKPDQHEKLHPLRWRFEPIIARSHHSHHSHHTTYHHTIHSWLTGCSPWRWHSVSGSLPHWRTHFDPCPASCAGYHSVPWQKETKNIGKRRKKPKISHIFKYNFVDTLVLIMLEDVGSHGGF